MGTNCSSCKDRLQFDRDGDGINLVHRLNLISVLVISFVFYFTRVDKITFSPLQ